MSENEIKLPFWLRLFVYGIYILPAMIYSRLVTISHQLGPR